MKLADVLAKVRSWLHAVTSIHGRAEVLIDSEDCLRVIFETKDRLAELLVNEGEFAPYRFVSFIVLDTRLDVHAEPVFSFRDDASHTLGDILRELDRGLRFLAAR